jgi:GNAT superfamily N-acetyltransferase
MGQPTVPAIQFEPAEEADGELLADVRVEAMRESLERVGRFDPIRARERFLSNFTPALTRHIVADGAGRARAGFVVIRPHGDHLLLEHLYFRQRYQGQGFGTAVLKQVFVDADRQSMDVRVGALRDSDANRFYARHGFVLVEQSEWDLYYVRRHRDGSEGRIV